VATEVTYIEETHEVVKEEEIFQIVEELPSFPNGEEARQRFLRENTVYPRPAIDMGVEGTVLLTFVVEKDGSITDIQILRGIPILDEEAVRVTKKMPKWKPGKQAGKPVRVQYRMPIKFVLGK
jgi:protein TonB